MSKVINMLTNVQTAELSLVRRGANNKRFALTKAEDNMKFAELVKTVLNTEAEGESALIKTLKSAGADDEAVEIAVANFRLQSGFSDKLSKEGFAEVAKAAGYELAKAKADHDDDDDDDDDDKPAFLRGKKKKTDKSHVPADMPVEMQKAFEDQQSTITRLEKEAKANSSQLETLRKDTERKEYVAKCVESYSHVPGMSSEEMGVMLQDAYEVSKDFGGKLEKQWEETSKALKESALLKTRGAAHATHDGSSPIGRLKTIAKDYKAKDPSMSEDKAFSKAMQDNPELYEEYLADNPAQTGRR